VATVLRRYLDLGVEADLRPLLKSPKPLPESDEGGVVKVNG
jgi:hypothetical protein